MRGPSTPSGRDDDERLGMQIGRDDIVRQRQRHVVVLVHDRQVDVSGEQQLERARRLGDRDSEIDVGMLGAQRDRRGVETKVSAALATAATRTGPPRVPAARSRSARAAARMSSTASARAASCRPAPVSTTPRGERSTSETPHSRSSTASCCETADGLRPSARAAPAIEPADADLAQQAKTPDVQRRALDIGH